MKSNDIENKITDIERKLSLLERDNTSILEKLKDLFVLHETIDKELNSLKDSFKRIEHYGEFKNIFIENLFKWIKFITILVPILITIGGYMAYEIGVYNPFHIQNKIKL